MLTNNFIGGNEPLIVQRVEEWFQENGKGKRDVGSAKLKEMFHDDQLPEPIFSTAEQIAFLSSRISLYPGDVVLTGTPAGAGAEENQFLKSGDTVKAWIEHIGELVTYII